MTATDKLLTMVQLTVISHLQRAAEPRLNFKTLTSTNVVVTTSSATSSVVRSRRG